MRCVVVTLCSCLSPAVVGACRRCLACQDEVGVLVQSSCPTPVETPLRSMLPGDPLQVHVPSTDVSPQTVFGSLDPKGLAALQAAFHDNFATEGKGAEVSPAAA